MTNADIFAPERKPIDLNHRKRRLDTVAYARGMQRAAAGGCAAIGFATCYYTHTRRGYLNTTYKH